MRRCLLAVVLVGCYQSPHFDNCTISCAEGCPSGMACVGGMCTSGDSCTGGGDAGVDAPAPLCTGTSSPPTIALGARHTCSLDGTGDLFCWGDNGDGQVGTGGATIASPARIGECWTAVAVGGEHTCALDTQGLPWCWGNNTNGQVSGDSTLDGHPTKIATPTQVAFPAAHPAFAQIAAGGSHSCAIGTDGTLWCWGNPASLVGAASATAQQIGTQAWTTISLGADHACGLVGGAITCFGANAQGQIDTSTQPVTTPETLPTPGGTHVALVSAGDEMTCAVVNTDGSSQGALFCWGQTTGLDPNGGGILGPTQVNGDTAWTSVRVGHATGCGVDGGRVVCWGNADHGGLADGFWGPRKVSAFAAPAITGLTASAVDVGVSTNNSFSEHACALVDGQPTCWGQNVWGEAGIGAASRAPTPVAIADVGKTFSKLAGGHGHACALATDHSLWCWGQDGQGQIQGDDAGAGETTACTQGTPCDYARPTQVTGAFDDVVAGDDFTCAFSATDSSIRCWGRYQDGALGVTGVTSHAMTTVAVPANGVNTGAWTGLTGGDRAVCGLTAAGEPPACWGKFPSATQTAPKALGTDTYGSRLFVFADDSAMGTNGGTRVVWGANDVDQLGTQFTYATPSKLAGDTDTMELAVAGKHGCKLTSAASVVCFGSNTSGESGLPAGNPPNTDPMGAPNPIALSSCTQVSVAVDHSCAVCGGQVSCWGSNKTSMLGRGSDPTPPHLPVAIIGAGQVAATGTGGCALDGNGKVSCWGLGDRGELGNGGRDLTVPTPIAIP